MPTFIVERYVSELSSGDVDELILRERRAMRRASARDRTVRHLRSTFVPEDDLCLWLVEAASIDAVRRAHELADLRLERITEAIDIPAEESWRETVR